MPTALATALVPWISNALIAIGLPSLAFGATVGAIALGASYLLLAGAAYLVSSTLNPQQQRPDAPKPEDGKYNLKQSVPPLVYVLGQVKKAGDYAFLEERAGVAHHVIVWAAHHIEGFVEHWLHDQGVALDGSGNVTAPAHFDSQVNIQTRLGDDASTAYSDLVTDFPTIWTNDHRGDGLATVKMFVRSVPSEDLQTVYPAGMPQYQAVAQGHDGLIDPRTEVAGYSENIAVFRAWHLSHPVGGKLNWDDLYLPDWANAANVCDEPVTNRTGGVQPRYYGGFWFRADNNPVQIGRLMDQAADMVVYERADGKVGVHAGEFVAPDVRLSGNDLKSVAYDANKRKGTTVLAVRGRYNDPDKGYNTADAAIYGAPYPSDDERTKTVDNQIVQRHNHCARLQKLAYIRANAPRVRIVAHYEAARLVPYRRFITVHYPPKMTEAVIEITGRPTLSLRNLTYEFEGIVVPATLYDFNSATEEGVPGANVVPIEREDVPTPEGFDVTIESELVGGGDAYFGLATWDPIADDIFTYELEWEPTGGGTVQSVMSSTAGPTDLRSSYIADNVEVKFRLRRWSAGTPSAWTGYLVRTP